MRANGISFANAASFPAAALQADAALRGFIWRRAVGDREVGFFGEPGAIEVEFNILAPRGRTPEERRIDQGTEHIPDFRPALLYGLAQPPWMFLPQDRDVSVVIDTDIIRTPPEQHGEAVGEDAPDGGPARRRPAFLRAYRSGNPIECGISALHLTLCRWRRRFRQKRCRFRTPLHVSVC